MRPPRRLSSASLAFLTVLAAPSLSAEAARNRARRAETPPVSGSATRLADDGSASVAIDLTVPDAGDLGSLGRG